ncbi:MAG: hypothetical protein JWL59_3248 [Chthoniobacteraceae bacterium]|nr:hypothetical protein [Chthoniobacteraceae bacterium]
MLRLFLLILFGTKALAQTVLVAPYLQPGNGSGLDGTDVKVLSWVTDQKPAEFRVEYGAEGGVSRQSKPVQVKLDFGLPKPKPASKPAATPVPANAVTPVAGAAALRDAPTDLDEVKKQAAKESAVAVSDKEQHYFTYSAKLEGLPFDSIVRYRVSMGMKVIREGSFRTRASAGKPIHFVAVGDLANGKPEQNAIAWQIAQKRPEFLVALGDLVYSQGRVGQYMHHFWPVYNDVLKSSSKTGAPLLGTIPIYPVIGNHDADIAKLPDYPDAFGAYYFFHVPLNGPGAGGWNLPLGKEKEVADRFLANVGDTYPSLNIYSWDYGPAHFVALDSNSYSKVDDPKFRAWLENDLRTTKQPWKFVCFHAPAFHTSREHYTEQKMRLLEPIFEQAGVDVVFAGHVHNYQRSKPLKFTPEGGRDKRGRVNGEFVLDEAYDGIKDTTPEGIIHVVSGGGGATLYKIDLVKTIEGLKKDHGVNYVPFTTKYVADTHSFSMIDVSLTTFELRQIGISGEELDHFVITKGAK